MAYKIIDKCIMCAKCEHICPLGAISLSPMQYEINPRKCNECKGIDEGPLCVMVCPVDVIIKREKNDKE
ncbi:MAG TPA: 4Fe-4S binding protein [Candidatus Kapabacteria bacterium]|nr:4Fe-4S binding protein [Candidatus Kapabacteria bacterium]